MTPDQIQSRLGWETPTEIREFARSCVVAAAHEVEPERLRSWLLLDERGGWERRALEHVQKAPEILARALEAGQIQEGDITPAFVREQIAIALCDMGLQALIREARRK